MENTVCYAPILAKRKQGNHIDVKVTSERRRSTKLQGTTVGTSTVAVLTSLTSMVTEHDKLCLRCRSKPFI